MDFDRPDGPTERYAQAEALGREHIAPSLAARDRDARWAPEIFAHLGEAGLLGALIPPEYGGRGSSSLELHDAQVGLGAGSGDAGLALAWAAHLLRCAVPLWRLGSEPQRRRYLPGLCDGAMIGAFAHRERGGAPQCRAVLTGGRWIVDGAKAWVINAPVAHVFLIAAVVEHGGTTVFVVDRDTPGLRIEPRIDTTGLRTATISDLVLEHCELADHQRLGDDGVRLAQRWERACGLGPWIGLMQSLLEGAIGAARSSSTTRGPLSHSQAIRARIADMKITLELCRRLQERTAWAASRDDDPASARQAATTRVFMLRAARSMTRHAAEIDGSDGLDAMRPSSRLQRDAAALAASDHGEDVLRSVIGGALLGLGREV